MRVDRTRYTNARVRRAKKSRGWLFPIGILGVIMLLYGYSFAPFKEDTSTTSSAETISPRAALAKNVQFVWPVVGQAAIGSVEDGFFARSSANEGLRPTASMAKVITALAIMEKQPFELGQTGKSYALSSKDVANYHKYAAKNGSVLPVRIGMELTQYQAIQMMLIASDNNMADMLAERTFGGMEAYISYAQDMLRRKGLNRTVIADASGFSSATVGTPSELVSIGIMALKNPVIAEIVAQSQAEIPGVGVIKNTNELLDTDGAVGIKTGTTNEAGSCLLFAARYRAEDGQRVTIVGVIMGDRNPKNLFGDSRNLLASARRGLNLTETQSTSNVAIPPPMRDDRAPQ